MTMVDDAVVVDDVAGMTDGSMFVRKKDIQR